MAQDLDIYHSKYTTAQIEASIGKSPKIQNGTWWTWDIETSAYIDTGLVARGPVYVPAVSEEGVISWTNNGDLENPDPVDIKGEKGDTGAAFHIADVYDTVAELRAAFPTGDAGAYMVKADQQVYIWSEKAEDWVSAGGLMDLVTDTIDENSTDYEIPSAAAVWRTLVPYSPDLPPFGTSLEDMTWAEVSAVSAAGKAELYFDIGDCKSVALKGTVGILALDTTLYVYIIGFDHNAALEGKGISFGCFKTAAVDGVDVCLVDGYYDTSKTDGTKTFNINHWTSGGASNTVYNFGGWKGCDLRYDVLGSTNVPPSGYGQLPASGRVGYDATAAAVTSPVANTLMAALPSGLRAVLKPITKYTDNVGGTRINGTYQSQSPAYVTASVDYLPLPAPYELGGGNAVDSANRAEAASQQIYAYYEAGNSRVKYRHSGVENTAAWRTRSVAWDSQMGMCGVVGTGVVLYTSRVPYSQGLAPVFLV